MARYIQESLLSNPVLQIKVVCSHTQVNTHTNFIPIGDSVIPVSNTYTTQPSTFSDVKYLKVPFWKDIRSSAEFQWERASHELLVALKNKLYAEHHLRDNNCTVITSDIIPAAVPLQIVLTAENKAVPLLYHPFVRFIANILGFGPHLAMIFSLGTRFVDLRIKRAVSLIGPEDDSNRTLPPSSSPSFALPSDSSSFSSSSSSASMVLARPAENLPQAGYPSTPEILKAIWHYEKERESVMALEAQLTSRLLSE